MESAVLIPDTHTLLWMDRDDPSLGLEARRQINIGRRAGEVGVSAISFWEVATCASSS